MTNSVNFSGASRLPLTQQRFQSREDALRAAAAVSGSEAIVLNTDQDGKTYFTLKPVTEHEVQQYGISQYDPNIVAFSIERPGSSNTQVAVQILPGHALSTRNALESALQRVIPTSAYTPALLNQLSRAMGFRDFDSMCQLLSRLPREKQAQLIARLTDPQCWRDMTHQLAASVSTNPFASDQGPSQLTKQLRAGLNQFLQDEIAGLFEGQGIPQYNPPLDPQNPLWSPAALLGIYNSLQRIRNESPADFGRIQKAQPPFTFKLGADPLQASTQQTNIAKLDALELLTSSMKIAHTSCKDCKEHTITIREGAIQGSSDAILNTQILEKVGLLSRGNFDFQECPGFSGGKKQWYTIEEMQARGLVSGDPPAIDRAQALRLIGELNGLGTGANTRLNRDQVWRLLVSFGNAAGVFQPGLLQNDPVLKQYLKPNSSGLDMDKLWPLFFPQGNNTKIREIEAALLRVLNDSKTSNQVLVNTVFKMEQMNQVQSLQDFLNQIKPGMGNDLFKDGTIGPRTGLAIQRLEGIITLNALKKNLPQPLTAEQNRTIQSIFNLLTAENLDQKTLNTIRARMKALVNEIPDRIVQESPQKTLRQVLNNLIERIDGHFNQQTTRDLVNSWLSIVDSEGDGDVLSDLVTHEIGHNLMEMFKRDYQQDYPGLDLARDWAAISGKEPTSTRFSMAPATRSYFNQAPEEVSDYGETNPDEDFAEAYRLFMSQPEELLKRAPTKFLVLNALTGRFSGAQIQAQFGAYQNELAKGWEKIRGENGKQFHLSADMLQLLNNTYGSLGFDSTSASSLSGNSISPMSVSAVGNRSRGPQVDSVRRSLDLPRTPPLTPGRMHTLKSLSHPPLSEAELRAANQAVIHLIEYIQMVGEPLDSEGIKNLLGPQYDTLPMGLRAQLEDSGSFLRQYLSRSDHIGQKATPQWVQREALSQLARMYEEVNRSFEAISGGLDFLIRNKSDSFKLQLALNNNLLQALKTYFQHLNQLYTPQHAVPDEETLKQHLMAVVNESSNPSDLLQKLLQRMGWTNEWFAQSGS